MSVDRRPEGTTPEEPQTPTSAEVIREALLAVAAGRTVDVAKLPLAAEEDRGLAQLSVELLRFAITVDTAVQMFLLALEVGPALSTLQMRGLGRMIQNRAPDCLKGQDGAFEGLNSSLERDRRFLIDLNEAYRDSIPVGVSNILATLDPASFPPGSGLLARWTRNRDALAELARRRARLAELPGPDVVQEFFYPEFQRRLEIALGMRPATADSK
jgi:hypothetical protein